MGLHEKLQGLAQRLPTMADKLATEEATKSALVMPFIAALGHDVFDPTARRSQPHSRLSIVSGEVEA